MARRSRRGHRCAGKVGTGASTVRAGPPGLGQRLGVVDLPGAAVDSTGAAQQSTRSATTLNAGRAIDGDQQSAAFHKTNQRLALAASSVKAAGEDQARYRSAPIP